MYLGKEYICDTTASKNWFTLTSLDSALGGYCRTAILGKAVRLGNDVYVCRVDASAKYRKTWQDYSLGDYLRYCDKDRVGDREFNGVDTSVCIQNVCGSDMIEEYAYDGKKTTLCVRLNHSGYWWQPIMRERIVDARDGEVYGVVKLGSQKWLNRDLAYWITTAYEDGGRLATLSPEQYREFEGWNYNLFYVWKDALGGSKDICPAGTHIPSKAEWKTLFTAVGGSSTAGKMLKSTSGWNSSGNGTDAYSFSALPAGLRNYNGYYNFEGYYAYFWSSTVSNGNYAYLMYLGYSYDGAGPDNDGKDIGFSVRCVMD